MELNKKFNLKSSEEQLLDCASDLGKRASELNEDFIACGFYTLGAAIAAGKTQEFAKICADFCKNNKQ